MVVTAGESGLRASEIRYLDALGLHRDLFYKENRIQTRYGKGFKGSGKRVRKTIMTSLAGDTLKAYEEHIRPRFHSAKTNSALFLTESGERLSYQQMWYALNRIVQQARAAGLDLPFKMSWHSLRKSFATNLMEQRPDLVWVLMDMMGHINPSTLHRYVKHSREYYEKSIDSMISSLMPNLV